MTTSGVVSLARTRLPGCTCAPGSAGNRRRDGRVLQLHARVLDCGAIRRQRRLQRIGRRRRRLDLLARGDAATGKFSSPCGLHLCVAGLRGIAFEVRLRLFQRRVERSLIELEEDLSFADIVAFLEVDCR